MKRFYTISCTFLVGSIILCGFTPIDSTFIPVSPKIIDSGSIQKPRFGDRVRVHIIVKSTDNEVILDTNDNPSPTYIMPGKSRTLEIIQQGLFMVGVNGTFRVWARVKERGGLPDNRKVSHDTLIIDVSILEIMDQI